jgi:hypothetical protein
VDVRISQKAAIGVVFVAAMFMSIMDATRLLMFTLGLSMAQVFVPVQAASFAAITPAATGRASTSSRRPNPPRRESASSGSQAISGGSHHGPFGK